MSSTCSLKKNFNQGKSLIREVRKCRSKGKQSRPKDNSLVIKQSQGPLVPPQGLWITFWAISCELFHINCHRHPSRWKKLIIKDDMLPISMWTPDLLDLKVDSYSPHHQPIRSMSMSWSSPLRTITIKLLTLFSSLGHMALRVLVHCGPIYLAK